MSGAFDDGYPSLRGIADGYRSGARKPSDVVATHLARVTQFDGKIGAFQAVYAENAILAAEAADRLFKAGYPLGPFHGIPFVLKDIVDVEGCVTTGGSKAMADRVSPSTGTIANRLLAAGGILLGKTKTVECALGGWGTNQHMGTPKNPWDMGTHRIPGGSSSGTGASVAAGLAICGVGTDTGGSVRLPSAYCGITGLKVTEGRLPTDGILPLSQTLDTPGPMARSVEDMAVMFLVMDGVEGAAISEAQSAGKGIFGALQTGAKGLRLGFIGEAERAHCTADILAMYDHALDQMRGLGAELVEFCPPTPFDDLVGISGRLICTEAYFNHGAMYERPDLPLDEDVRRGMLSARDVTASEYQQLLADRQRAKPQFLAAMAGLDAVLTPTTRETAPPLAEIDPAVAPRHFTRPANYYGLCALSLPMGLAPDGLPAGLQIIGKPHDEAMALRIGAAYEAQRGPFPAPHLA